MKPLELAKIIDTFSNDWSDQAPSGHVAEPTSTFEENDSGVLLLAARKLVSTLENPKHAVLELSKAV